MSYALKIIVAGDKGLAIYRLEQAGYVCLAVGRGPSFKVLCAHRDDIERALAQTGIDFVAEEVES